jgi:hypothetical protein
MKRFKLTMVLGFVLMISASVVNSQTPADAAAIKQTALDYIEGWYEGNAERMEKALHPDLAKRIVRTNPQNNRSALQQMSAMSLVQGTRAGGGKDTPKEKQQKDVTILMCLENAPVKVVALIDRLSVHRETPRPLCNRKCAGELAGEETVAVGLVE